MCDVTFTRAFELFFPLFLVFCRPRPASFASRRTPEV